MKKMETTSLPEIAGILTMFVDRDRLTREAESFEHERKRLRRVGIELNLVALGREGPAYS